MRYELTDHEWTAIKPMLPNKPRGVPRQSEFTLRNSSSENSLSRKITSENDRVGREVQSGTRVTMGHSTVNSLPK